jgi:hypothetical protein
MSPDIRLTYAGTLDDVCQRYPRKVPLTDAFYRNVLLRHVLYGHGLVLNDGYLVANPYFRKALSLGRDSLAYALIEAGIIRILSIGDDIEASIVRRAESGVTSHQRLVASEDWPQVRSNILRLSEAQRALGAGLPWPPHDMTDCFLKLMRRTRDRAASSLGLSNDQGRRFSILIDRLEGALQTRWAAPRTQWEDLCRDALGRREIDDATVAAFMAIANEAYHIGFTACLSSGSGVSLAVETFKTGAFDELLGLSSYRVRDVAMPEPLPAPGVAPDFDALARLFSGVGQELRNRYLSSGQDGDRTPYVTYLEAELGPLASTGDIMAVAESRHGYWLSSASASTATALARAAMSDAERPYGTEKPLDALQSEGVVCVAFTQPMASQITAGVRQFTG